MIDEFILYEDLRIGPKFFYLEQGQKSFVIFGDGPGATPPPPTNRNIKISVIGVGKVGMAIAHAILTQDLADKIALVNVNHDKLCDEMLDLQHAAAFLPRTTISASVDHSCTVGSDLVIVTVGARQFCCKGM
ncbi:putative L-lactate dehydrogenase [Helianthus annuus]|nr:putative L-lactate dehydrogenase [Helianthus annuus]